MIAIEFSSIECSADEDVKKQAAVKQMRALMARLEGAPKYHTLTTKDRTLLIKEGYARDLVDNLIFITERMLTRPKSYDSQAVQPDSQDNLELGFNYAAFDPALFASNTIRSHLAQLSDGCCALCESPLAATQCGEIAHFRPVDLLDNASIDKQVIHSQCSPYYALAYEQENLLYVCRACNEQHKIGLFPVSGPRFPKVAIENEHPLLVSPYHDKPRDYIRFNPFTGQAYSYDKVAAFLMATRQLTAPEVEQLIWSQPDVIPVQAYTGILCDTAKERDFSSWFATLDHQTQIHLSRGELSIDSYGLNRPALVNARRAFSAQLLSVYTHTHSAKSKIQHKNTVLETNTNTPKTETSPARPLSEIPLTGYRSFAIDALNSWQHSVKQLPALVHDVIKQPQENANNPSDEAIAAVRAFPMWFRSCIKYCVGESHLTQQDKRQLVFLSGQDAHYGQKSIEKSVFLAIDWLADQHKVIKVKSHRNIWETSFAELACSRAQQLTDLFSHNEIWVEGPFAPLAPN